MNMLTTSKSCMIIIVIFVEKQAQQKHVMFIGHIGKTTI